MVDDRAESSSERERRVSSRIPVDRLVSFVDLASGQVGSGWLGNLSSGGVFVRTTDPAELGAVVTFGFYLQHRGRRHLVRSRGRVSWVSRDELQPGFGIAFLDRSPETLEPIEGVIHDQTSPDGELAAWWQLRS